MTPEPNPIKAAAQLRCRQPRMTRGGWESPHKVACQSREVAGVWDILEGDDPRRIPLCRQCADDLGRFEEPIAVADDLPGLIDGRVDWCHLAPGLRIVWCPTHSLIEEE